MKSIFPNANRFIIIAAILSMFITTAVNAQYFAKELTGRVITTTGDPIPNLDFGVGAKRTQTDFEGKFTLKNVDAIQTRFYFYDKINIRAIKFGNTAFYPHDRDIHDALSFSFKPGSNITNLEVITEPKHKIRGKIVFKNGEPLTNTSVEVNFDTLFLGNDTGFKSNNNIQTDAHGKFIHYANASGVFILSINHRGLSAVTPPILYEITKQNETIVLTLDGNSHDMTEPVTEGEKENTSSGYYGVPDIPGVWIVNPENSHAYKWVKCKDWIDAKLISEKENAHLVTINSEEEQIWLESVFTHRAYWIGLTDSIHEGKWEWVTGEPVTYTNWRIDKYVSLNLVQSTPSILEFNNKRDGNPDNGDEGNDYAIFFGKDRNGNVNGKWVQAHKNGGRGIGQVSMAILEKKLE